MPSTTTSADGHIAVTTLAQTDGAQRWIGVSIVDSGPGSAPPISCTCSSSFTGAMQCATTRRRGLGGRLLVENLAGQGAAAGLWLASAVYGINRGLINE